MRKFSFRLQKVLEVREGEEKAAQRKWSQILNRQNALLNMKRDLSRSRERQLEALKKDRSRPFFVYQALVGEMGLSYTHQSLEQTEEEVKRVSLEEEEERTRLLTLRKKRKSLELLREKLADDHKNEEIRREWKALDDLWLTRIGYKDYPPDEHQK